MVPRAFSSSLVASYLAYAFLPSYSAEDDPPTGSSIQPLSARVRFADIHFLPFHSFQAPAVPSWPNPREGTRPALSRELETSPVVTRSGPCIRPSFAPFTSCIHLHTASYIELHTHCFDRLIDKTAVLFAAAKERLRGRKLQPDRRLPQLRSLTELSPLASLFGISMTPSVDGLRSILKHNAVSLRCGGTEGSFVLEKKPAQRAGARASASRMRRQFRFSLHLAPYPSRPWCKDS